MESDARDGRVDKVLTIGCFDLFHEGHINLIREMRRVGKHVIVGVHDSRTYYQLKNKFPIDSLTTRMLNANQYADQVFCVAKLDASPFIQCIMNLRQGESACYLRGDDGPNFPYRPWLETIMPVRFKKRDPPNLRCAVQQYAWGKPGEKSEVAKLSQALPDFKMEADQPYAELWMGTHPKAPSVVLGSDGGEMPLTDWLAAHPEALGQGIRAQFGDTLPFLFKVLSVNKALSIQAHPNKLHAETLHKERPDKYPDPNHKPEMAIALTQFEGLCGFRPLDEIVNFLKKIPEFRGVIGEELSQTLIQAYELKDAEHDKQCRQALKQCFTALMTCDSGTLQNNLSTLVNRLQSAVESGQKIDDQERELLLRLNIQFPGDGGCFCIYFLNHMMLEPGQAMFLEANLPHAYLSGDCIECMACSDNVVRAGLTPKFKDVSTLCEMLLYDPRPANEKLFQFKLEEGDPYLSLYNPPVPDFAVAKIQLPADVTDYTIKAVDSASIILTIDGQATGQCPADGSSVNIKRGVVFFVSANQSLQLKVVPKGMLLFRAFCDL